MPEGERQNHPSYGLVQFSRINRGGSTPLFGSSIEHSQTIVLRIKQATLERGLHHDWYYDRGEIIEVEMSQSQFAEAITSMNMGSGVPVTIRWIKGIGKIEESPFHNQRLQFEEEFKEDMEEISSRSDALLDLAKDMLESKKAPTKAERERLYNMLAGLKQHLASNMPFIQSSFNEAMDKTVMEAKGEIEAFVHNKVNSLGIQGLQAEMLGLQGIAPPSLPEGTSEG